MRRRTPRPESIVGRYAPVPHVVLDSVAYQGASFSARALLMEIIRQHCGSNNGHMQLSMGWLRKRGWNSWDVLYRARAELLDRGLIIETRKGGLNNGPSRFALTWLDISNFSGLDLQANEYRRGAYALLDAPPKIKTAAPSPGGDTSGRRSSSPPSHGGAPLPTPPSGGAKAGVFGTPTPPSDGDNESIAIPHGADATGSKQPRRLLIVGSTAGSACAGLKAGS